MSYRIEGKSLTMEVKRGAESWQFFAFIFAALSAFEFAIIDDLNLNTRWKLPLQIIAFVGTFYLTMLNSFIRNRLVGVLIWIKNLEKSSA